MRPLDGPPDSFRYSPADVAAFGERFTLEPVAPDEIRERADTGQVLVTTDIPEYLGRPIASEADASIALYRLVQLFGTPNVPTLVAGADQPPRRATTWQYLFEVTYRPEPGDGSSEVPEERQYLLSVHDNRTDVSAGVSKWTRPRDESDRMVREPSADPLPDTRMPADELLAMLVQLALSTVEHVVEATYEDLRV